MTALFLKLLDMSITAGWLILAVAALRIALKKAPKWVRCLLWALVAVRLICPVSLESSLSLIPDTQPIAASVAESAVLYGTIGVDPAGPASPQPDMPPEVEGPGAGAGWVEAAAVLWLAGMGAILLYAVISYARLRRRVRAAMLLRDNVWLCDKIDSPFILGFFRPRIYLPSAITEEYMTHVVAHEQAHLKRRDHWWKPLGFALLTVYWFNPLVWLAYILLCRDIELACDEKVIKEMGVTDKKAYSEALLACSMSRKMITACPLAFGEVGVKARIKSVLHYKKPALWVILAALLACVLLAVGFLTDPIDGRGALSPWEDGQSAYSNGVIQWLDYYRGPAAMPWSESRELELYGE